MPNGKNSEIENNKTQALDHLGIIEGCQTVAFFNVSPEKEIFPSNCEALFILTSRFVVHQILM